MKIFLVRAQLNEDTQRLERGNRVPGETTSPEVLFRIPVHVPRRLRPLRRQRHLVQDTSSSIAAQA